MQNTRNLLIGIAIGVFIGVISYSLFFNVSTISASSNSNDINLNSDQYQDADKDGKALQGPQDTTLKMNSLAIDTTMNRATGITRSTADDLFQNYHQTRDPDSSLGIINVTIGTDTHKLRHFFLSYDKVIRPLKAKIDGDNDHSLVGFAGLPAFNDTTRSHTMVWVAVVENENEEYHYYLPSNEQANDKTFIYDFIDVCPNDCPRNEARIWKEDWKE